MALSRTRLELLQWFGLLAAPLAWAAQVVVGVFAADGGCARGLAIGPWQVTLALLAGTIAVLAELAAFTLYRALQQVDKDAPGPHGRLRFFALAALLGNVLFFVIIVLDGVGTVYHLPCGQS